MDISVIIPNYNGEPLLKKNLSHLYTQLLEYKKGRVEIIIIDDASRDNSVQFVQEFRNKQSNIISIVFIKNKKNQGFSTTVNIGAEKATGDILLLLNTDVVVGKNFLLPLLSHFIDEKVFAVGCHEESIANGQVRHYGRGKGKWQKGFLIHGAAPIENGPTLWVGGGSGAFRKIIWDRLKGLDVLYNPFYWEDIDLSYRAAKSGYKVLFEKDSLVKHEHDKGAIKSAFSPFAISVIAYRNQFIFVWKNATDISLRAEHVLWLPYHFIKAALRFDTAFYLGFIRACMLFPRVIRSSIAARKLFIKKDKDITDMFFSL